MQSSRISLRFRNPKFFHEVKNKTHNQEQNRPLTS
uniref:Uncharacterized protein n=1 Tax=Rhizophora mucronata TaxID=61149 RepID=A0A2P2QWD7_RHIMU